MIIQRFALVLCCLGLPVVASGLHADGRPEPVAMTPTDVKWESQGALATGGIEQARLVGDPSKPGPYTIRLRFPAGYKLAPHTHPDYREVTILSGTWYTGYGEKFDAAALKDPAYGKLLHGARKPRSLRRGARAGDHPGEWHRTERSRICQSAQQPEIGDAPAMGFEDITLALFAACNFIRVFAYIPQIHKAADRCERRIGHLMHDLGTVPGRARVDCGLRTRQPIRLVAGGLLCEQCTVLHRDPGNRILEGSMSRARKISRGPCFTTWHAARPTASLPSRRGANCR